jgi:hypothetical protein
VTTSSTAGTTKGLEGPVEETGMVISTNSPVFTQPFKSKLHKDVELGEEYSKLVQIKVPSGLVDMFGRAYPSEMYLWVHHFDDYGVIVEGTYEATLARKALKRVGYKKVKLWGYRPILINRKVGTWPYGNLVGGRSCVCFYFDVGSSIG